MICRLCQQQKPLIEAHIIPRCLHGPLKSGKGPMLRLSKNPSVYPRRSPTGEYDTFILCGSCDNLIGRWDDYACEILVSQIPAQPIKKDPTTNRRQYYLAYYDYHLFKLFSFSVLRRMSISTRPAFRHVALGPIEAQLHARLISQTAGSAEEFCRIRIPIRRQLWQ
jgi:hypothetical protein